MVIRGFCLMSAVCLFFANAVFAQDIQVLNISAEDETATVRTADGKIRTIKKGDVISKDEFRVQSSESERQSATDKVHSAGSNKESSEFKVQSAGLRVTEISEGRIVFEEKTNRGMQTVIIRVENGKQKIERISKIPDSKQIPYQQGGGEKKPTVQSDK
jgi:uncharacterized beta-barrel protein YwiB (DUF1934 family)